MNTYNVIWENGNTTKFKTFQNLDFTTIKVEFEKLSKIKVKKIEKIEESESWEILKAKEKNFMFSYTIYKMIDGEKIPFYYNRNIIPEFEESLNLNDASFENAMRNFKNTIFGNDAKFNNGCMV